MFRAMFSPIIRSILLYLQYLVVFTQVATLMSFNSSKTPAGSNLGEYTVNSQVLLMMGAET
jgi:hypothetical protein